MIMNVIAWFYGARESEIFSLDAGIRSHTKGVWFCVLPFENGNIIIYDIEGLGNLEYGNSSDYDVKLFAISLLLSRTILMNVMASTLHGDWWQKIEALTLITKYIEGCQE